MSSSRPRVSVVVLNYNGRDLIERCLDSVLKSFYKDFEIMFVDNGSSDGSPEYVRERFGNEPKLKIIPNDVNLGAAGGFNLGVRSANGEILVFLNIDTQVDPYWLDELIDYFLKYPSLGAAQSLLLEMESPDVIQSAGLYLLDYCGWNWRYLSGFQKNILENVSAKNMITIGAATGAALAVRRLIFQQVGGFDGKFTIYFEETDLCWRIWLAGYCVSLVPRSIVYHLGHYLERHSRFSPSRTTNQFNYHKNNIRMLLKNYSTRNLLRFFLLALALNFGKVVYALIKRGSIDSIIGLLKGIHWNLENLKNTLKERSKVQRFIRKVSDDYVLERISRRLPLSLVIAKI